MWWTVAFLLLGVVAGALWAYFQKQKEEQLVDEQADGSALPSPRRQEDWKQGEDLKRYPRRLAELERQLEDQHSAAREQVQHLSVKHAEMAEKPGREELAGRYKHDLDAVEERSQTTRRVMATVWKTRAILHLRVHLAIAARQRPELDHLPQPLEVDASDLDHAADSYSRACRNVRAFVRLLDQENDKVAGRVPSPPLVAEVTDEDRAAVEEEVAAVQETLGALRERMDNLADTLDYLSDRFRTQRVVESGNLGLDLGPEAGALLSEVSGALGQLEALSAVGDKGLADAAVDGLSEDIGRLERAGLDSLAEAEAMEEVDRLLEQFARKTSEPPEPQQAQTAHEDPVDDDTAPPGPPPVPDAQGPIS